MIQINKYLLILGIPLIFLSCNKKVPYPQRFNNIPTGTKFFYGPNGNFYILPEEQIDTNSYRIKIYNDSTGKFKFEGLFKFKKNTFNINYHMGLSDSILYFNDSDVIYVKGRNHDTLSLLLDSITIHGKSED